VSKKSYINNLKGKKIYLVSVYGWLSPLLWAQGEAEMSWQKNMVEEGSHSMTARKQRET
jgi:hypothetical protein